MQVPGDFEDIRSYRDDEVKPVFKRLSEEPFFLRLIEFLYPDRAPNAFLEQLLSLNSIADFQTQIIRPYIQDRIIEKTCSEVVIKGLKHLNRKKAYVYISNHRDIILDSALLNVLLSLHNFECTEIAIGDNLLIYPWITDLVKLNRSFIVKRSAPRREMVENSKILSAYIRHKITEENRSVWIAQRQGRAKDGDDRTQEGLLKMLHFSQASDSVAKSLKELKLVPLSISYEYDPCDHLKARELLLKNENPEYKKTGQDDLESMETGMKGFKGRVVFQIGKPLGKSLDKIDFIQHKNEKFQALARIIDQRIHRNYHIFPNNYIATDLLNDNIHFSSKYSDAEKEQFEEYLHKKIQMIGINHLDPSFLRKAFLEMYAFPLRNYLAAI